ncbi:MAG: M48 family metallopeptidase [Rhodobacteraceae bacterium]|nr:M48 family metallopeptidase [Paracoccaceae bacterium]
MLKFTPILLAILYALAMYAVSAFRTKRELDARSAELVDPRLTGHFDRLAKALEVPRIKVMLYEIDAVNGLAAPDGRIFLTRGFYNKFRLGDVSGEELAAVVAHEIGHVALGHSRKRLIDFSGQNALRTALAVFLSRFIPGVGVWIANSVATLLAARMSRDDEFEADAYATALLIKAGIGTAPQKSLFRKLGALTSAGRASIPAWFLSHPSAEARIAAIETNETRWHAAT